VVADSPAIFGQLGVFNQEATTMARWDHGYVTDVAYTTNAYQETMPSWLAACSVLLGYRPTDLAAPFRYADLGCGNGLSALIVAATNPQAEVWGFDFNPTHIENARVMADWAKLTNVHFEDVSFESLAHREPGATDLFDIVVSHGVLSWISLENRRHLTSIIGRWLRPGGLAYLSYNVSAGWSGVEPIRLLMRQLAEADRRRTDQSVGGIFQVMDQLRTGGAAFFRANPGLEARLEQMKAQDPRYLAHEFLNRDWHPVMFADVAEPMTEARTHYIGSATTLENIDAVAVPEGVLPVLAGINDTAVRETIRDLASAKNFRRDMWRKGGETLPVQEHLALLDAMTLVWTGKTADAGITFPGPVGTVTGQPDFYFPLLEAIREAPKTIGQLRALPPLRERQPGEFIQAALLLMGGGFAHPRWGAPWAPQRGSGGRQKSQDGAARLNVAIINRLRMGVDLHRLAAPQIGSSVGIEVMEGLVIGQLLDGTSREPDALIDGVLNDVARSGRSLLRDGKPMQNPAENRVLVGETVRSVLARRLPVLRTLGVID
jgi:SAM-dependent methyltransferase